MIIVRIANTNAEGTRDTNVNYMIGEMVKLLKWTISWSTVKTFTLDNNEQVDHSDGKQNTFSC